MSARRPLALLLASFALAVPAPTWAEDEEPAPKEEPSGKEEPKGGDPAKPETIANDWKKNIKNKMGVAKTKERGAYWEGKGVAGKDLFWLGLIWERGQEYGKAVAAIEGALQAPDLNEKNKEFARQTLVGIHGKTRDWAKLAAAAEAFRADFPTSGVALATWVDQGRAHRMAGEKDKALAAFEQAAQNNNLTAIFELIDLQLGEGDAEAAKAVLARYEEVDIKGKEQYFAYWKDFLAAVGTEAPALTDAKSVGKPVTGETTFKGKPTVLYYWHMQVTNPEARIGNLVRFGQTWSDRVHVAAVGTYNKYNPDTSKKEEGMTEEQELDWYRQFNEKILGRGMPVSLVVPAATRDALKLKFEGTKLLLDAEGKFRYARLFENAQWQWDWLALELATKKLAGS